MKAFRVNPSCCPPISSGTRGDSPFLAIPRGLWLASNHLAFAIRNRFPVSPGHTLIVPHRHVAQWWDATRDEQSAILDLVDHVRHLLFDDDERARVLPGVASPDGFNLIPRVGFRCWSD